jgi:peroxiredoxin Q/BCP
MTRAFLALASLAFVSYFAAPALAELKEGDNAPDFELVGSDGKTYKLSDYKGKQAVVVAWFPRAFTGGCTAECKSFKEKGDALKAYDIAYFTASTDPAEKNKDFAKSLDLDYPILSDPEGKTATAYGIYNKEKNAATRWTFIVDKEGKIAFIDKSVKTGSHATDIAAKLAELKVAKK